MYDWAALVVLALGVGFAVGACWQLYASRDETDLEQEPWKRKERE
jgi:hypothetical protein